MTASEAEPLVAEGVEAAEGSWRVALGFTLAALGCACAALGAHLASQPTPLAAALQEILEARPLAARQLELERRQLADESVEDTEEPLLTKTSLGKYEDRQGPLASIWSELSPSSKFLREFSGEDEGGSWSFFWKTLEELRHKAADLFVMAGLFSSNAGFAAFLPFLNFVQGFEQPGVFNWFWKLLGYGPGPKWKPPVKGETMGLVSFNEFAKKSFGGQFPPLFDDYVTGERVPSWEDNVNHKRGIAILDAGMAAARRVGIDPIDSLRFMEPRFAFDNEGLTELSWQGFYQFGPKDIKYASNGVWGIKVVEELMQKYGTKGEVLGPLLTDSAFSAHLTHDGELFHIDMSALAKYKPIPGYAPLGGKASFKQEGGRLKTVSMEYNGTSYKSFEDESTEKLYKKSVRAGWRMAEASIIASLLSMTNLVFHVKDLHLEIAATFQALTVNAFAEEPDHPIRRMLDPFVSRSVQATNDNFKLLFEYKAAEFSLAPLPYDEQLKLMQDFIDHQPLNLAEMDMTKYGELRGMNASFSSREANADPDKWGWRWHYRALSVQNLYDELLGCWLDVHYPGSQEEQDHKISEDKVLGHWWSQMVKHLHPLRRAVEKSPSWVSEKPSAQSLRNVLRTIIVWLSWIHEDVGHSAASYVYNPVYTPMCVPEDGRGVPIASFGFNVAAYRGFVFLERAALLDDPPTFWFDSVECTGMWWWHKCSTPSTDKSLQCFADFQHALEKLGKEDSAFSECDKTGFYSCVERVETAVSS
eukprot:TRINITY_DN47617_c0_g1_i1.p1 TRINITY_DN47617_c0_g1~~TRINITY_DN47617_c0_g1_i1.p1  ORF type:complete len:766 (+),score=183.36 TRINITY_DN47617_c0_g1_i1:25-2298(+)